MSAVPSEVRFVRFPSEKVGLLIGRNGTNIEALKRQFNCSIVIAREASGINGTEKVITLRNGTLDNLARLEEHLLTMCRSSGRHPKGDQHGGHRKMQHGGLIQEGEHNHGDSYIVPGSQLKNEQLEKFKACGILFYRTTTLQPAASPSTSFSTAQRVDTLEVLVGFSVKHNGALSFLGGKREQVQGQWETAVETACREFYEESGEVVSSGMIHAVHKLLDSPSQLFHTMWWGAGKYVAYLVPVSAVSGLEKELEDVCTRFQEFLASDHLRGDEERRAMSSLRWMSIQEAVRYNSLTTVARLIFAQNVFAQWRRDVQRPLGNSNGRPQPSSLPHATTVHNVPREEHKSENRERSSTNTPINGGEPPKNKRVAVKIISVVHPPEQFNVEKERIAALAHRIPQMYIANVHKITQVPSRPLPANAVARLPASYQPRGDFAFGEAHDLRRLFRTSQVNAIFDRIQSVPSPACLRTELMPHQRFGLSWMVTREKKQPRRANIHGPDAGAMAPVRKTRGGMIADDCGLGKTLQMISLIVLDIEQRQKRRNKEKEGEHKDTGPTHADDDVDDDVDGEGDDEEKQDPNLRSTSATLIVCPKCVLRQWRAEFYAHVASQEVSSSSSSSSSFPRILMVDGEESAETRAHVDSYDVVITSHNRIMLERKSGKSLFHSMQWRRVVVDEGHVIRNENLTSAAVIAIPGKRRWLMSGTFLQNSLEEFSLYFKFLRFSPYDDDKTWKALWKRLQMRGSAELSQRNGGSKEDPFDLMQQLINPIFLYRTKADKDKDGNPVVALPAKQYKEHLLEFASEAEKKYYKSIRQLRDEQVKVRGYNLTLLLRERQACCHIRLEQDPTIDATNDVTRDTLDDASSSAGTVCPGPGRATTAVSLPKPSVEDELVQGFSQLKVQEESKEESEQYGSTKIDALLALLTNIPRGEKAVIFSQFVQFLKLIEGALTRVDKTSIRYDGSLNDDQRATVLHTFNTDTDILLLSLRAGGVGLNLSVANHLFLMDVDWNPAVEKQALDRVYRIGQTKTVHIHRLIINHSIETKMLERSHKKESVAMNLYTGAAKLSQEEKSAIFM